MYPEFDDVFGKSRSEDRIDGGESINSIVHEAQRRARHRARYQREREMETVKIKNGEVSRSNVLAFNPPESYSNTRKKGKRGGIAA